MRQTAFILAGLVSIASIGLVGCDVHKTQEGKVDLPKYEVSKTQEGNVQLPKYDVDAPKVDVGLREEGSERAEGRRVHREGNDDRAEGVDHPGQGS